jgi:outer membrane protein assembly factor BamB
VVDDGTLYIGSSDLRRVSAIDPESGNVLWRSDVFGWTWGTPLVDGDRLHVGAAAGTPYFIHHAAGYLTLDRATGKVLARHPFADTGGHQWGIAGSPAMGDGVIVVATIAGSLFGFPPE